MSCGDLQSTIIGRMTALALTLCYEEALRAMQNSKSITIAEKQTHQPAQWIRLSHRNDLISGQ